MKIFHKVRHEYTDRRDIYIFNKRIFSYYADKKDDVLWEPIEKYIHDVLKHTKPNSKKLIVIPSDPIDAYDKKGQEDLEHYYNPHGMFDFVFVISPAEHGISFRHGMHIIGVDKKGMYYKKALKLIKPDIIRAYGGYWAAGFATKNRITNCPIVVSVHDKRQSFLYDDILNADKVICVSPTVVNLVKTRGVNTNKIILMYDRVDRKLFRKTNSDILDKNVYNILCVARISPEKNQATLIRALSILGNKYHCTFIGQGDTNDIKVLAKSLGVFEQTSYIARVSNTDLPRFYSSADCMCVPSLCEGFGIVFIEAAACECPVITSDIEPMNLYLKHSQSAILVKEYTNAHHIAMAIKTVCEDKKLSKFLGKNARKATILFDKAKIQSQEESIYKSLLGQ